MVCIRPIHTVLTHTRYHGAITREETDKRMTAVGKVFDCSFCFLHRSNVRSDGLYLVRDYKNLSNGFVLSTFFEGNIYHLIIRQVLELRPTGIFLLIAIRSKR
jgi:hypothetical protein